MTKILIEYPPIYEKVEKAFNLKGKKPLFAYDGVIYNPHAGIVDDFIVVHEEVHFAQQNKHPKGVDGWWNDYIENKHFRFEQELEAFRAQYKALVAVVKDRNYLDRYVTMLADELSGPLYGNLIGKRGAAKIIKSTESVKMFW